MSYVIMCLKPYSIHCLNLKEKTILILDIDDQNTTCAFASNGIHVAYMTLNL